MPNQWKPSSTICVYPLAVNNWFFAVNGVWTKQNKWANSKVPDKNSSNQKAIWPIWHLKPKILKMKLQEHLKPKICSCAFVMWKASMALFAVYFLHERRGFQVPFVRTSLSYFKLLFVNIAHGDVYIKSLCEEYPFL